MAGPFLNSGGGRRRVGQFQRMSDINVTPFVDVMLVLLVVFMITAPLLSVGVPIDLPKATAKPLGGSDEPLTISITGDGTIYLQETQVGLDELVPRLKAISENRVDVRIFVRGDRDINYGSILRVMAVINTSGYKKVALVAETPKGGE